MLLLFNLEDLLKFWDTLLFSEVPAINICLFRCLTGVVLFIDTLMWIKDRRWLLYVDGWFAYEDFKVGFSKHRLSLLKYLPPNNRSVNLLLYGQLVLSMFLILGLFSQLAAFLCYITMLSIHSRNPYSCNSGDIILRFFCVFLSLVPSGQQISLASSSFIDINLTSWQFSLIMVQLFMITIYFKNIYYKSQGKLWRDGSATQKVLNVRNWTDIALPKFLDNRPFHKVLTYTTLLLEGAMFSLIWIDEFRYPVLIGTILLHLGMAIFMKVKLFQMTMITGLVVFIKPVDLIHFFQYISHVR